MTRAGTFDHGKTRPCVYRAVSLPIVLRSLARRPPHLIRWMSASYLYHTARDAPLHDALPFVRAQPLCSANRPPRGRASVRGRWRRQKLLPTLIRTGLGQRRRLCAVPRLRVLFLARATAGLALSSSTRGRYKARCLDDKIPRALISSSHPPHTSTFEYHGLVQRRLRPGRGL